MVRANDKYSFLKNNYRSIKMGELTKLPNIGKVLEEQLNDVGINTADDLINIGSKEARVKIKEIDEVHA